MPKRLLSIMTAVLALPVGAVSVDSSTIEGVTLVRVQPSDDQDEVIARLQSLLDDGQRTVLIGSVATLSSVRPPFARAWPSTTTIVLDPSAGLGISGFDAPHDEDRLKVIADWSWGAEPSGSNRVTRATGVEPRFHAVAFTITAPSPAQMCRNFSAETWTSVFGDRTPSADEFRAYRREVRRWCQYGNLSMHTAAVPQFVVPSYRETSKPRLSLLSEWALIRSEDRANPDGASYLFWTRTLGDGAGTGFTREGGGRAWVDSKDRALRDIADMAIHSGWGFVERPDVTTAWPSNSSFPYTGDIHLFRCDAPAALRPLDCPASPMLRKLYPGDSFNGRLTISAGETMTYGGEAKLGASVDSRGKASASLSFGLQFLRGTTRSVTADVPMVQVSSNASTVYYRSTRWTPDVDAIYRWLDQRREFDLTKATPLATTLDPRHEILWELPLEGNAGRALPYHVVYEMGLNTCDETFLCVWRGERAKARVGWMDSVTVYLPLE
jgi:hypothetical protein